MLILVGMKKLWIYYMYNKYLDNLRNILWSENSPKKYLKKSYYVCFKLIYSKIFLAKLKNNKISYLT